MQDAWLDVHRGGETKRYALLVGRTRVGGEGCDVCLDSGSESDGAELHIWSDPPRVVFVGRGEPPLLDGRVFEQAPLETGSSLQWRGAVLVFGQTAVLEELPAPGPTSGTGSSSPVSAAQLDEVANRVRAGLLADLNLTDKQAVKRWRTAVMASEFDPAACARDLLAGEQPGADGPRLLERATRLQRDLLMSAHQRGIKGVRRRARAATRTGAAYVLANLIAISVYSLVVLAVLLLVRVQYGTSMDGTLDGIIGVFGRIVGALGG